MKLGWESVKHVHAAELENEGKGNGEGTPVCGSSDRIMNVALRIASAEELCVEKRMRYFLENTKRRLGAVLDCFLPSWRPDEKSFQLVKKLCTKKR